MSSRPTPHGRDAEFLRGAETNHMPEGSERSHTQVRQFVRTTGEASRMSDRRSSPPTGGTSRTTEAYHSLPRLPEPERQLRERVHQSLVCRRRGCEPSLSNPSRRHLKRRRRDLLCARIRLNKGRKRGRRAGCMRRRRHNSAR